jgi:hypothetical protein
MSTRATYEINERGELKEYNCFYIHHDGYLEGGANYFKLAKEYEGDKFHYYSFSEKFFRANVGAHFTEDHKSHGDTEFRYSLEVSKDGISIEKQYKLTVKAITNYKANTWKKVFEGSLDEFIKLYYKE